MGLVLVTGDTAMLLDMGVWLCYLGHGMGHVVWDRGYGHAP